MYRSSSLVPLSHRADQLSAEPLELNSGGGTTRSSTANCLRSLSFRDPFRRLVMLSLTAAMFGFLAMRLRYAVYQMRRL